VDKVVHGEKEKYSRTRDLPSALLGAKNEVMDKIEKSFCSYANILTAAGQLVDFNKPAESEYNSVDSFRKDEPLCDEENHWLDYKEDLLTLRPGRDHAWLDTSIEHLLRWLRCPLIEYIFCSPETKQKTEGRPPKTEVYYTRSRIDRLVAVIIMAIILALLIIPIYLLYHLVNNLGNPRSGGTCLGVLLVATLAFSAILSLFTKAKRHEILGAAAAYCAVLVVFLGNVPQMHTQAH
jgi:hypothetical protein